MRVTFDPTGRSGGLKVKHLVIAVFVLVALGFCAKIVTNSSDGDRIGKVTKFSHKGWIKTWEGDMITSHSSNQGNTFVWSFSVPDNDLAKKIEKLRGRVADGGCPGGELRLWYEQQRLVMPWTADTDYFVTRAECAD